MYAILILFLSQIEPFEYTPYNYESTVVSVYDGDTVTVDVDLGLRVTTRQKLRLYQINAPEVKGVERPRGLRSRDWLREQIPNGSTLYLKTIKDRTGKYGRFLAILYKKNSDGTFTNLNRALVEKGYARYHDYD